MQEAYRDMTVQAVVHSKNLPSFDELFAVALNETPQDQPLDPEADAKMMALAEKMLENKKKDAVNGGR